MKAVHFGAGNIGRGFIGLLLVRSGYEVCFADVNERLVNALKERGEYPVTLANAEQETTTVTGVTAVNSNTETTELVEAIAEADLVTTAVGVSILKHIAGAIAKGIALRAERGSAPLHIIACENAIGASSQLKRLVYEQLDDKGKKYADEHIAFPDAAVDRIVPLQQHEDMLKVVVEPFFEWVVDKSQLLPEHHVIEGVKYVERLEPYIERKLFTVNTGHCSAAYIGNLHEYDTIQTAMNDSEVVNHVASVLKETGAMLTAKHGFDPKEHEAYIATTLERFQNPALKDEVARVGRSPIRKLSPLDRLTLPALRGHELGTGYLYLARTMAAALLFNAADDPEAHEVQETLKKHGPAYTLSKYSQIPDSHPVHQEVMKQYEILQSRV